MMDEAEDRFEFPPTAPVECMDEEPDSYTVVIYIIAHGGVYKRDPVQESLIRTRLGPVIGPISSSLITSHKSCKSFWRATSRVELIPKILKKLETLPLCNPSWKEDVVTGLNKRQNSMCVRVAASSGTLDWVKRSGTMGPKYCISDNKDNTFAINTFTLNKNWLDNRVGKIYGGSKKNEILYVPELHVGNFHIKPPSQSTLKQIFSTDLSHLGHLGDIESTTPTWNWAGLKVKYGKSLHFMEPEGPWQHETPLIFFFLKVKSIDVYVGVLNTKDGITLDDIVNRVTIAVRHKLHTLGLNDSLLIDLSIIDPNCSYEPGSGSWGGTKQRKTKQRKRKTKQRKRKTKQRKTKTKRRTLKLFN